MATLRDLGNAARSLNEEDYGSDRQIDAANLYHGKLAELWPIEFNDVSDFSNYCLKATDAEMVDKSFEILGARADLVIGE